MGKRNVVGKPLERQALKDRDKNGTISDPGNFTKLFET
jgi:hypothetical protein